MNTKMFFMGSLLSIAVLANAEANPTDAQMRSLDNRVSALEQKKGANAMVNPSGRPQVRDGADLFFTADWLLWQAHANGMGVAIKAAANAAEDVVLANTETKNPHFNWNSGFRVGMGWNTPHDGWDVHATWTWFQNKAKRQGAAGYAPVQYLPTQLYAPAEDPTVTGFTAYDAEWRLHLNLISLDLGREFFVSKWMTLRPFMGVQSGWIYQKQNVAFTGALPIDAEQRSLSLYNGNKYWGLGPKTGLDTQWGLGYGFSLVGNAGLSLLYGFFDLQTMQSTNLTTPVNNINAVRVSRAITEVALGLRWDTMFANDRCHFWIQGGWENLMFFGLGQNSYFLGTQSSNAGALLSNQTDMTIQGWTLSTRLDF